MILVVGTGRSGTSAISRVLQERLGVDMGGPGKISESNEKGDYENSFFRNKIDIPYYRNQISKKEWFRRAHAFAEEMEEPWGIKDPRNAYFLDMFLEAFPEATIIWSWRNPEDVAQSMYKWYAGHGGIDVDIYRQETASRLWHLTNHLAGVEYLPINMTEHREEETLAEVLDSYLRGRAMGYE